MLLLSRVPHIIQISYDRCLFLVYNLVIFQAHICPAWETDGLCAKGLGQSVNKFLDQCFRGHHFFSAMRTLSLKDLYKVSCCPGYSRVSRIGDQIICKAVCKLPCVNGACLKPDTCVCNVGYFLKSRYVCSPICQSSCRNGTCIGVDHCVCNNGYKKINGLQGNCEPVCEPDCVNGRCASPNVCECDKGHEFTDGSSTVCEPRCDVPCVNGVCSQPNKCGCFIGYEKKSYSLCTPVCHSGCGIGTCDAPNTCTCPAGYNASLGQACRAVCQGCTKGSCISPGVCHCPNGYTFEEKYGDCVRRCEPPCFNGDCIEPGICNCRQGYTKKGESYKCEPYCEPQCINGRCVKPGQCECNEGYKMEPASERKCKAICTQPCINGSCVAPEICQCLVGYMLTPNNTCAPICLNGCGPGICISPNVCACPPGYESIHSEACQPVCPKACVHGTCIEPEICVCSQGYFWNDSLGECVPKCDKPCINATCIFPNRCECLDGYIKSSDTVCSPRCSSKCENGDCTSPDFCSCYLGYNKCSEDPFICLPELGVHNQKVPTAFLNVFNFPAVIRHLDDNDTFSFTKETKITLPKNCQVFFQSAVKRNSSIIDLVQLDCSILETTEDLNYELYCQRPLKSSGVSSSYDIGPLDYRSLSEKEDLRNFTLSLEFPKEFNEEEDGLCSLCIQPLYRSKYFSLGGIATIFISPCSEVINTSFVEGEVQVMWFALLGFVVNVLVLIIIMVVKWIIKSSSMIEYENPEAIETVEISNLGSNEKTNSQNCQLEIDKKEVIVVKNRSSLTDCLNEGNNTQC